MTFEQLMNITAHDQTVRLRIAEIDDVITGNADALNHGDALKSSI